MVDQGLATDAIYAQRLAVRIARRLVDGDYTDSRIVQARQRAKRNRQSHVGPAGCFQEEAQITPAESEVSFGRQVGRCGWKQRVPVEQRILTRHHDIGVGEGGADVDDRLAISLLRSTSGGKKGETESGDKIEGDEKKERGKEKGADAERAA
jgi:hypothetical protein